jgi:hypothetical protein
MAAVRRPTVSRNRAKKARDLESIAQLLEDVIPNFKREEERQFYREIVESCRLAAHEIVRESQSVNQSGTSHSTRAKTTDTFNEEEQRRLGYVKNLRRERART